MTGSLESWTPDTRDDAINAEKWWGEAFRARYPGRGSPQAERFAGALQAAGLIRRANAVLELDVAGTEQLTLVKDVQKDPVRQVIEHIDLLVVRKGEKVHVEVPVLMVGESFSGTIATLDNNTVRLEVEATNIPQHVEVNVDGLEDGTHVTASELVLPKGATLLDEPDLLFVAVSIPSAPVEAEEEIAEADVAEAAAQAEGAVQEESAE